MGVSWVGKTEWPTHTCWDADFPPLPPSNTKSNQKIKNLNETMSRQELPLLEKEPTRPDNMNKTHKKKC